MVATQYRLIVFSDDWGRHPSSCQHLIRQLVERYPVLWVNTIGMRRPTLGWGDLQKIATKLKSWLGQKNGKAQAQTQAVSTPDRLQVMNPLMWPGFEWSMERKLNTRLIGKAIHRMLGTRQEGEQRIVITTLPITADLIGHLEVDRWIYYCVDDFATWPGLNGPVMQKLEEQQIQKVDSVITVSASLQQRVSDLGKTSRLLTHGIDLDHWIPNTAETSANERPIGSFFQDIPKPILLFWGLIDTRLDMDWCRAISQSSLGTLVLVGPEQSPDPALAALSHVKLFGPASYDQLPAMAQEADVLVMPYADLPVTRAMQPLKFKEYLATGKPVVARALPGIVDWAHAADLVSNAPEFLQKIQERFDQGICFEQQLARGKLMRESWADKAKVLEQMILELDR